MSRIGKAISRLKSLPSDYTWSEATRVLHHFGYEGITAGKTGGSRRKFFNNQTQSLISLHEPHPRDIMTIGAVRHLLQKLIEDDCIEEDHEQF